MGGGRFELIGNAPCVDLVNTEILEGGQRVDLLGDFRDLVAWLVAAQLLGPGEATAALDRWSGTPEGARAVGAARTLRADFGRMLERIARGRTPSASTVATINTLLARRIGHGELVRTRSGFRRRLRFEPRASTDLLVPVAEATSDFLCHADLSLVRKCENAPCLRYFYDVSKNHARRWCSMSVCGNRAKVAAFHARRASPG